MSSSASVSSRARVAAALAIAAATAVLVLAAAARWPDLLAYGLMPPDERAAAIAREVDEEFGMTRPLALVIVARDGDVWTRAHLATVQAVTRDVLAIPGVVATDVVSLASPNMRDLRLTDGGLEPTYLMGDVPTDATAIAALRKRVDDDPNYGGNLVSRDGAAALVVANFYPTAADAEIAGAAVAIRERYQSPGVAIHAVGAAVLAREASNAAVAASLPLVIAIALGSAVLLLGLGGRLGMAAVAAAILAVLWTTLALVASRALVLPWSLPGIAVAALLATIVAAAATLPTFGSAARVCVPLLAAGGAVAWMAGPPASAFGVALSVGGVAAVLAGLATMVAAGARGAAMSPATGAQRAPWLLRLACLAAIVLAWLGASRLDASFGLAGYGERFLPAAARGGLDAMRRHFPPPTTLVVRLRGEPGFVADPALLGALETVAESLRGQPGVRSVQSLADIVKLVHRSFNDGDPAYFAIPDDRGLVARYLTLAYSPGFRRFVDRGLSRTALWVYLDRDDPATLAGAHDTLAAGLAAHVPPGVEVDPIAGDGAAALAMAGVGSRLASAAATAAAAFAVVAVLLATGPRLRAALDVAAAASAALLVGAGVLGWLGLALDLVTVPVLGAATLLAAAVAVVARERPARAAVAIAGSALAAAAVPLVISSFGAAHALVPLLVAPLTALAVRGALGDARGRSGARERAAGIAPLGGEAG